jgi:hypothetical protein
MARSWRPRAMLACIAAIGLTLLCLPGVAAALPAEYPSGWGFVPGGLLQLPASTSDVGFCKGPSGYVFELASDASAGGVRALVSKVAVADGTVADSWVYPEAGTNAFLPKAVARDAAGNIVVAMQDQSAGGWMVAKFTAAGALLWDRPYAAGTGCVPYSVCCDRAGAVIVTGQRSVTPGTALDGAVVKWTSGGTYKWARPLSGVGAVNDLLLAAGTDANNNVYVCGVLGSASLAKAVLRSYTPAGRLRWKMTAGQATRSTQFNALVVKGTSVYVAGTCRGAENGGFIAAKYTLGGKRLWGGGKTRLFPEGAGATSMAVDRTNAVVVVGEASELAPAGVDVPAVWKLSPLGKTAWHRELTGTGWSDGSFAAVGLDSKNRIYAAGFSGAPKPESGGLLMRYSAGGTAQAMWTPDGESWASGEMLHVLVLSDTGVLASGILEQGGRRAVVFRAATVR